MEEDKKNQMEKLLQFMTLLETEGEEGLTSIMAEIRALQEKLCAVEFKLNDKKKSSDNHLFFFFPVGVREEKDGDRELQTKKIELQAALEQLNKKLEEYRFRKGKLEAIRAILIEKQEQLRKQDEEKEQEEQERICLDGELEKSAAETGNLFSEDRKSETEDSTVQALTGLVHKMEFCLLLMDTDPVRVRLELQKIIENVKVLMNEI